MQLQNYLLAAEIWPNVSSQTSTKDIINQVHTQCCHKQEGYPLGWIELQCSIMKAGPFCLHVQKKKKKTREHRPDPKETLNSVMNKQNGSTCSTVIHVTGR